jgi:hypothetical protein
MRLPRGSRKVPEREVLDQMLEAAMGAEPATSIIRKMLVDLDQRERVQPELDPGKE